VADDHSPAAVNRAAVKAASPLPPYAGARPFEPAPAVDGVARRTVYVRAHDGITLAGTLRVPEDRSVPAPAVVLSPPGPAAVSDQSVVAGYADRLTAAGYVTLALDPRSLGRSAGSPRQHFEIADRLRDLQAAISYLTSLGDAVNPNRIGAFGASAGATVTMVLAAHDPRVAAFVCACGGFFNPRLLRDQMGPDVYDAQLRETFAGLRRFHLTGELEYMPIVTPDGVGAFLAGIDPHPTEPYDYYGTERGASERFENQITTISFQSIINFDYLTPAEFVGSRAGLLLAGTDDVYVPLEGIEEVHRRLTGPKDLVVIEGANHIDFYDNAPYVAKVTEAAVAWFTDHL
jgi:uncharacterized protein